MADPLVARRGYLEDVVLDERDRAILANVPAALAAGLDAFSWWQAAAAAGSYRERFPIVRTFNPADSAFGFFDEVPRAGRPSLPVMGVFQEMLFDRPKTDEARHFRAQLCEFVLRYFLRVSDFRRPAAFVPTDRVDSETAFPALSWCPSEQDTRAGFGYSQLYYKLAGSGRVGKFPRRLASEIVDLREIGPVYDWVVAQVRIFDFNLDFQPLGPGNPHLRLPLQEDTLVILAPELIRAMEDPEPGVLGRYGLGYALLKNPTSGVLAYGPGHFDAGFQTIDFKMLDDGEVRACLVFTVNRPEQILNLTFDPLTWGLTLADVMSLGLAHRLFAPLRQVIFPSSGAGPGFDPIFTFIAMANALTGGRAAGDLCISRDRLERDMLVDHFMQHYTLISGSLTTWRRVADWLDPASIPDWVVQGQPA